MSRHSERLSIVVDKQEIAHGHPWSFPKIKATTTVANLIPHGCDYTVRGYTGVIGVERKSYGDWIRCIAQDWDRFTRQLDKLKKHTYRAVIVEGNIGDYIIYSRISHKYVLYRTTQIVTNGIPVIFARDKDLAAQCCWDFFQHSIRRLHAEQLVRDDREQGVEKGRASRQ